MTNTPGLRSGSHAAIASAMRLVALILLAMISALMAGFHRVLIGSPARLTTPVQPGMAAAHFSGETKVTLPPVIDPRRAMRAALTSRVKTLTS